MGRVKRYKPKELLATVERHLAVDQPELIASLKGEVVVVSGTYCVQPLEDGNVAHGCLDKFDVEIYMHTGFPMVQPVVREVGGKIPKTEKFHINNDGTCCLEVWETWLASNPEPSIADFFDIPLRNFFLGQIHKVETGVFPHDEHEHGEAGLLSAYAEQLGCVADRNTVVKMLQALSHSPPRGHWDCPCGSGQRIRNCCIERLVQLGAKIPPELAQRMLKRLTN